jgi:putative hemolysin
MFRSNAIALTAVLGVFAAPLPAQQQVPNPAAQFCRNEGGTYRTVPDAAGERGVCVLPDGRETDAWEYFRERHSALPMAPKNGEIAEKIWSGGPILTMVDSNMRVEALAVAQGVIIAAGPLDEVMALRGPETEMIDLAGRTMIPGFVDAHGHCL